MKKLYQNRLLKLANHLEKGKLGHDKFNFTMVHQEDSCGTQGCALGECPYVFPRYWKFEGKGVLNLKSADSECYSLNAEEFFGLSQDEVSVLFHPHSYDSEFSDEDYANASQAHYKLTCGIKQLGPKATKKQVAKNIVKFVEFKNKAKCI